jgi:hypothetical protein
VGLERGPDVVARVVGQRSNGVDVIAVAGVLDEQLPVGVDP